MNLLFRYFYHLFLSFFSDQIDILESDAQKMRVWPHDLDLNFHLNNGRFLSFMDIGRTRLSVRTGLFNLCRKNKWGYGVVGGSKIIYLKSLAVFQQFTLKSFFVGHKEGWIYIEQRFESKGKLVAAALVKVTFLRDGKRVPSQEILNKLNYKENEVDSDFLESYFISDQKFLNYVKMSY